MCRLRTSDATLVLGPQGQLMVADAAERDTLVETARSTQQHQQQWQVRRADDTLQHLGRSW